KGPGGKLGARERLAATEDATGLTEPRRLAHERLRGGRVELEHVVVAGDCQAGADRAREPGGFGAREVPGHATLGGAAVDGKERQVHLEYPEPLGLAFVGDAVPRVVEREGPETNDVAEVAASALRIPIDRLVGGRHGRDPEAGGVQVPPVVQAERP